MSALPATPRRAPRARPAARPSLRLVTGPSRARRYTLVAVALVAAALFGCVAVNALAAEQAFVARELQADVDALSLRYDELTVEVARLQSPKRIRRVAERRLGMVDAVHPGYLVVDEPAGAVPVAARVGETAAAAERIRGESQR